MALCCCKFINTIFAFTTIMVGVVLVAGGAYLLSNKPGYLDFVDSKFDDYYNPICQCVIGVGIFIILSGISGIYGSCAQNKCFLSIYWFSSFILLLVFCALLIVTVAYAQPYYKDIKANPTANNPKLAFLRDPNQMILTLSD